MDQTALISSAEEQLRSFGTFLDEYDQKLNKLLQRSPDASVTPGNSLEPLVAINYSSNQENLPLVRLLESDRLLNKTLLTFGHLCQEIELVIKEARCMQNKFLYIDEGLCVLTDNAEGGASSAKQTNERVVLKMSCHMEFLCQMHFLLQHCIVLGNNLLHQCAAFLGCEGANTEFKLFHVFDFFSDLLRHILIFDEILPVSNFARFWPNYKKTVAALVYNRRDFEEYCTSAEINGLQNCLQEFDYLFMGAVFRHFLDSIFALKDIVGSKAMGQLTTQFNEYVKQELAQLDKFQITSMNNGQELQLLVRLNAFCVVFHDFCGQIDSKHIKHLLELNVKNQGIMLVGNVSWEPTRFLRKHATSLVKSHEKLLQESLRQAKQSLHARVQTLQRDCRNHCTQLTLWSLQMRKSFTMDGIFDLKVGQLKGLSNLLLQGLRFAGQISFLVKALVHAHVAFQTPMTKPTLLSICKLIELLKVVQETFHMYTPDIAKVMQCILQYLQYKILHLLAACKKKITTAKMHDRNVDALAALKIAEKCVNGPPTQLRILVVKLALDAANSNGRTLPQEQYERLKLLIDRIELLADLQLQLHQLTETSFLYWHQSLLSAYLKQIVERKMDFHSFQYLVSSADSCGKLLETLELDVAKLSEILKKSNYEQMRTEIISNLCAKIETFLRLEVHSNLQLERMHPFEQDIDAYKDLIEACPIEINGNYVVLKDHVENYLSAMFYNLTTISLHDWKTYAEMRHLANNRLALNAIDDYLPNQTLEQGIDILEIMRKIHIFVSKYVYNMNSQIFVEQHSNNKHLDTIGIRHVANSLRTHGSGVINTTVNFTYQFLRQKFYTFSQFLFDEQIKSRLLKELRSFTERKQGEQYPFYPYERAEVFNKDIRRLGLANDGQSYMDLFRKVITHVGNAMGYIRLIRSGNMHANYSASLFLPTFDEHLTIVEQCRQLNMHDVTIKAAENFESNVSNLVKSFSDSVDYFKLLLEAFQPFFRNSHNFHLRTFYLIVPPLTLNFVEHMLSAKECLNRRDHQDALLFDDGFAVGLAYILKLLNQVNDFNTLQWFNTVRDRFEAERLKIKEMSADISANVTSKGNAKTAAQRIEQEKLQQTLALTERRINSYQTEFNLLYFSMGSAKIFFQ